MDSPAAVTSRSWNRLLLLMIVTISGGSVLRAQQPAALPAAGAAGQHGFHFSIAMGSSSVSASCPSCAVDVLSDRINGFSGTVQVGGAITPKLIVAGEFMGWMRNDVPIYRRIAALNIVVIGYPTPGSGFFVRGGGGALRAIIEDDFTLAQTDAFSSQIGVGYDFPMGNGRLKFTPQVTYISTFGGATTFNGISSPEVVAPNMLQIGIGLTFH